MVNTFSPDAGKNIDGTKKVALSVVVADNNRGCMSTDTTWNRNNDALLQSVPCFKRGTTEDRAAGAGLRCSRDGTCMNVHSPRRTAPRPLQSTKSTNRVASPHIRGHTPRRKEGTFAPHPPPQPQASTVGSCRGGVRRRTRAHETGAPAASCCHRRRRYMARSRQRVVMAHMSTQHCGHGSALQAPVLGEAPPRPAGDLQRTPRVLAAAWHTHEEPAASRALVHTPNRQEAPMAGMPRSTGPQSSMTHRHGSDGLKQPPHHTRTCTASAPACHGGVATPSPATAVVRAHSPSTLICSTRIAGRTRYWCFSRRKSSSLRGAFLGMRRNSAHACSFGMTMLSSRENISTSTGESTPAWPQQRHRHTHNSTDSETACHWKRAMAAPRTMTSLPFEEAAPASLNHGPRKPRTWQVKS